ncbi:fungal-specific transcription factor domain-containing protein [Podospora conica]|nr:fungal-specific transcription factor domain-containing protein [Schizothecium conicum]
MALLSSKETGTQASPNEDRVAESRPAPYRMARRAPGHRRRGVKLSWPPAGDHRRALVGRSAETETPANALVNVARMIHVSHRDVELYYQDANSGTENPGLQVFLDVPQPFDPTIFHAERHDLFQYFQLVACRSLAVFGHDPVKLGNALVRIACASDTTSAIALTHAILAMSALHRSKVHSQAFELKISALRALTAASGNDIGTLEATQHVATVMLLCTFEIQYASCTSGDWTWYLHGVKTVIEAAGLDKLSGHEEMTILLDWVHYHDVTARFSLRHWMRESVGVPSTSLCITSMSTTVCVSPIRSKVPRSPHAGAALIELLADVGEAVSTKLPESATAPEVEDHRNYLNILDWRIRNAKVPLWQGADDDTPLMLELYQLSLLMYLHRASGDRFLNQPSKTQGYTERALFLMQRLQSCDRQLPVFIIGCEARSDEQRGIVLDLMARSERRPSSRSFNYVRLMLEGLWARDDLADGDLGYWDRVTTIITRCKVVPSFV